MSAERTYPPWVTALIGVPFNAYGWTPEEGLHCWSLVRHALQAGFSIDVPRYVEEGIGANHRHVANETMTRITTMPDSEWRRTAPPQFGDVLLFRVRGGFLWHCGLCLDHIFMLHTHRGINASLGRYNHPYWKPLQAGAFRHDSLA